jgi:glyoxylase-like metal-dependent hydrolase (beta-lactamase superfamily II)
VPAAAFPLAPGLWRIPTARFDLLNSYAFVETDGSVTLVDAGYDTTTPRIVAGLAAIGRAPQDVRRVVLTHAHADHAGGAAGWQTDHGSHVAAHRADADSLGQGRNPAGDRRYRRTRLLARFTAATYAPVHVDVALTDGEVLDVAGGLRVVHTPGHTPGHVSLLHEPTGVLVTGDVVANVLGLNRLAPMVCQDYPLSLRSSHVLAELDYRVAAFTHGPPITDGARDKVRRFIAWRSRATRRHERRWAG